MRIPTKIQHGDKVISTVYAKINGIIDYLNASRVKPGTGIRVQETPSGTVVSSVPKTVTPPQLNTSDSGATGIESDVTGGTASIVLAGGTGSVNFVGTGAVTISGNTNTGNIEINATGGTGTAGFPDLITGTTVSSGTNYPVSADSWLIGHVGLYAGSGNYPAHLSGYVDLKVSATATPSLSNTIELYCNQGLYEVAHSGLNEWFPVCIPIKAGYTIRLTVSGSASVNLYLFST